MLGKPFELGHPGQRKRVGTEESPGASTLGITYPAPTVDELIAASRRPATTWGAASIETRAGVCLEILHRINRQSFLIGNAVMHTTGQGFAMAFQAGGPHAQDRGLEAVAYACHRDDEGAGRRALGEAAGRRAGADRASTSTGASCRAASASWSAARRSRPGTAIPACSPASPPATP